MESWHESSCHRPDVSLVDGVPFCMGCGSLADSSDLRLDPLLHNPTGASKDADSQKFDLSWPSSVRYGNVCIDGDGNDVSEILSSIAFGATEAGNDTMSDAAVRATKRQRFIHPSKPVSEQESNSALQRQRILPKSIPELGGTDSIRLLVLSRGQGSDPLHGSLEIHKLKYFPEYEALSYTWADATGSTDRVRKLYLNREWRIFPITVNCEAALRALRLPTKDRRIWVDAICIDQESNHERTQQVQLMPVIYATAQRVLIYLGDKKAELDIRSVNITEGAWETGWEELDARLKRPYFFRSWIIQEIAVAKTALVNNGTSWQVWPLDHDTAKTEIFLPWIKHFDSRKYRTPNDLVKLVIDSWSSQASDPRDKVFALLGVIAGAAADGLVADYSLSVEQVYTGFAAFALLNQRAFHILKYAGAHNNLRRLPSWVPDWHLLSRDWNIMHQLELFYADDVVEDGITELGYALNETQPFHMPWQLAAARSERHKHANLPYVHMDTGTLSILGVKLLDLTPPKYGRTASKLGFALFGGSFFFIIAPPTTNEGDSVFFLRGLDKPVILRRRDPDRNDIFTFIGFCYVRTWSEDMARQGFTDLAHISHWSILYSPKTFPSDSQWNPQGITETSTELERMRERSVEPEENMDAIGIIHYQRLQVLGRSAEEIWLEVLQRTVPDMLLAGGASLPLQDFMEPVLLVLEDLKQAIVPRINFWADVVLNLEQCLRAQTAATLSASEGTARASVLDQVNTLRERVHTRSIQLMDKDYIDFDKLMMYNDAKFLGIDAGLKDEINKLYVLFSMVDPKAPAYNTVSEMFSSHQQSLNHPGPKESQPGAGEEGYCPRWYYYQGQGSTLWWYTMRRDEAKSASCYLQEAEEALRLAATTSSSSPSASSVPGTRPGYGPVDAAETEPFWLADARQWLEAFENSLAVVDLTKKAVAMMMRRRKDVMAITKDGWKPVFIV